eukprot:m.74119 g.74119  ORF g.74119 m.74119 type:complete len:482 (+) comp12447_c0_seq5:515-1960(+)
MGFRPTNLAMRVGLIIMVEVIFLLIFRLTPNTWGGRARKRLPRRLTKYTIADVDLHYDQWKDLPEEDLARRRADQEAISRMRVCPPNSHDTRHKGCVCATGFSCVGHICSNDNYFELFGRKRCLDCRCDAKSCNRYRAVCGQQCQKLALHLGQQPRGINMDIEMVGLPKVQCFVYTDARDNEEYMERTKPGDYNHSIMRSWGQYCDGIHFFDSANISSLREPLETFTGNWFFFTGIDTYVIMRNMKRYLAFLDYTRKGPQYIGRRSWIPKTGLVLNSAHSGFLLNKEALRKIVSTWDQEIPVRQFYHPLECRNGTIENCTHGAWDFSSHAVELPGELHCTPQSLSPDNRSDANNSFVTLATRIAVCLAVNDIYPSNSADGFGFERFHDVGPSLLAKIPPWEYTSGSIREKFAPFPFRRGLTSVSTISISFGSTDADQMEAFEAFSHFDCYFSPGYFPKYKDKFATNRHNLRSIQHFKKEFP